MKSIQTMALVLKTANINDNDKLVTFFSPEYGRITAIGKGVRSHKHKDFAALQPFCFVNVTLSAKQGGLYTVASSSVASSFFDLRSDVLKVSFASYYTDVIFDIAQEIVGDEEYFSFLLNTLYLTEQATVKNEENDLVNQLKKLKAVFEIKTACVMGVMPELERCVCCGGEKNTDYFSYEDGGVVCRDCIGRYSGSERVPVPMTGIDKKIINYIINSDYRSVFSFSISEELLDSVCSVSERYLTAQTETFYKSLSFLHKMLNENI